MSDLKQHFARLVDHLEWADQRALGSLRSAPNVPAKALETYAHILGSEHVWLSRLYGTPARIAVWPNLALERGITYRNSAGEQYTSTLEDILTHVFLHGSYHRGQVASLVRAGGGVPSPTDYIFFTRGFPAATR